MRNNSYMIKAALAISALICFSEKPAFPQSNLTDRWKRPGFFLGSGGGLAKTDIINNDTKSSPENTGNRKLSYYGSLETGFFFSDKLGVVTGLSYHSAYSSYISLETYHNQYFTFDVENDPYELIVTGSEIGGAQEIGILSIPVSIIRRFPIGEKSAFTLQPSIQLYIPLYNSFETGGNFTYKGYFPAYNVVLEDLPEYGFHNNLAVVSYGKTDLKPISFGASFSVGFDYLITKRIQATFAVCHARSVTSISHYSSPDELLTSETIQLDNSLKGSNETRLKSTGIVFSLRYFLTDFKKFKYYFHSTPEQNLKEYERQYN